MPYSFLSFLYLVGHSALTEVIELENTLDGSVLPQDEIIRISEYAHKRGIKIHLDGARIWHVAIKTGIALDVLCQPFDSVSACFSKGLGQCEEVQQAAV